MLRKMSEAGPEIARQLKTVLDRISVAAQRRPKHLKGRDPRLVAVSKTKPASMIIEAYSHGQRHFGENYIQELVEKANDPEVLKNCSEIKWHFIGHLQKNKVNKVTSVPGLFLVETVDSEKLAKAINSSWDKLTLREPLAVLLQINTSGEESKNGVDSSEAAKLALTIRDKCPHLHLAGLMTIGAVDSSICEGENPDFKCLVECRRKVAEALGVPEQDLELSMGMSQDYEKAIEAGSTNVRVGSTIFGAREYPPSQGEACPGNKTTQVLQAGSEAPSITSKCMTQDTTAALEEVSPVSR